MQFVSSAGLTMAGFLTVFAVGTVFLVFGAMFSFFGDHVGEVSFDHPEDAGGDVPSVFSVRNMAAFAVGFGAAGTLAIWGGYSPFVAHLAGLGAGVIMAGLIFMSFRALWKNQNTTQFVPEHMVGRQAFVETAIREHSVGEIRSADERGESRWLRARSMDGTMIPVGSVVEIADVVGDEAVVKPLMKRS